MNGNVERLYYDGELHYLSNHELIRNLLHRDWKLNHCLDLFGLSPFPEGYNRLHRRTDALADQPISGDSLFNPLTMEMDVQLTVPADQLPTRGTVDAWLFAPIEDEFQTDVSIISARPQAKWVYCISEGD